MWRVCPGSSLVAASILAAALTTMEPFAGGENDLSVVHHHLNVTDVTAHRVFSMALI